MNQIKHWTKTIGVNPSTLTKYDFLNALKTMADAINIHNDELDNKGKITEKDLKHSDYLYELYIAWANEYRNHKCYVDNIIFRSV
tara:strand:+ start:183 stop:437 length:255 start_codon:yes stop_codon:yes gene_type:complete